MTMRQRHQRTRDVFDTGPFGGHRTFGAIDEENGGSGQSTPEQIRYHENYWYHVLPIRETGVSRPLILYYEWTVYDNASDVGNTEPLASGTELTDQAADAAAKAMIDSGFYEGLPKEDIVYESFRDVYYAQVVMEVITPDEGYSLAYKMLGPRTMQHANWPTAYAQGMASSNYDPANFLEQFEAYERAEELDDAYNPGKAPNPYTAGEYLVPNVGQALLPDEKVPGSKYHYWDGNLDTHNWVWHGISTDITTGKTGDTSDTQESYPTPICDAIGGYAMSITHYIASYNEEGGFNGYRVLAASELDGGIPAGIPIATVMQMFTKPAKTRNGKDFAVGTNFYYDTEKKPIWRKSIGMPMSPSSFFLLEPELATKNKINKITNSLITWDLIQNTHNISGEDAESTKSIGHNKVRSIFGQLKRQDTLNRDFGGLGYGSFRVAEKSKLPFAARVEWLGEGGEFGTYSKHPTSIPDCNGEGKTMVVYRFPRQLDPVADKVELQKNNELQMPNYEVTTATKYCYPYPGKSADKNSYALIGRLLPKGSSDDIGADKFTTEINGEVFGGRRSIKFIPMVTPSLPPSTSHRPYRVGAADATNRLAMASTVAQMMFDKVDQFCFDTSSMRGATIAVADPLKTAYFNNSMITNAYFIDRDFDVGSTAFVIGQCMLSYEMDSASIDTKLGLVDASERMILTTRYSNAFGGPINSGDVGQRSDKLQPRSPRDGTNAGKFTDDYLIPTMTMTTEDLVNGTEPIGALAVRETFKKIFGYELTAEWFGTLRLPNQDPDDPTRYTVTTTYGKFSYPYSIVGFTIPGYYNGPVLRYGEDGEPVGATDEHPGFIGKSKAYVNYQSPFGTLHRHTINFSEEIAAQNQIIDSGGSVTDVYENQTDSDSGAFGEGIEDVTQLKAETIQFEEWVRDRLMEDYGNVRFTNTIFNQHINFLNKDYVTGKMLLEAGYTIPGIDMTAYENEARYVGIPVSAAELEEPEPTQVMGLGSFTDASGFTITDVTAKWGAIGSASPRYTGDVGMSMVPYDADVVGEEMGYMAMSNLDGLGYPGEGIVDSALDTSKDLAMEGAKWGAISVGAPIGVSAGLSIIMLAGTVAVGYMTKGALDYGFEIVGRKKKEPPN